MIVTHQKRTKHQVRLPPCNKKKSHPVTFIRGIGLGDVYTPGVPCHMGVLPMDIGPVRYSSVFFKKQVEDITRNKNDIRENCACLCGRGRLASMFPPGCGILCSRRGVAEVLYHTLLSSCYDMVRYRDLLPANIRKLGSVKFCSMTCLRHVSPAPLL